MSFSQTSPSGDIFVNNLMPESASLTTASGSLVITPQFRAATMHFTNPHLDATIHRIMQQLRQKTDLSLSSDNSPAGTSAQLTIAVQCAGEEIQSVDEDESYSLSIAPTGATIKASTVVGAMHGLETLVQLVEPSGSDYVLPSVTIDDLPRFAWRGLMIDCGSSAHVVPAGVARWATKR